MATASDSPASALATDPAGATAALEGDALRGSGSPEIAFFDVETSVPQRAGQGYALLEFGAILVCPRRLVVVASYATLVRPADPASAVSAASVRCNGITRDAVSGAPPFCDVADAVYDLLNGERPRPATLLPVIGQQYFLDSCLKWPHLLR
jgi:DNA polymerase III epsilon subunit-like protein